MTDIHDLEGRTPDECFELAREALTQAEKAVNSATSTLECAKAQAAASIAIGWARLGDALSKTLPPVTYEHKLMGLESVPTRTIRAHRFPSPTALNWVLDDRDTRCQDCGRCGTHAGAECIGGGDDGCLVCAAGAGEHVVAPRPNKPKRHKFPDTIRLTDSLCRDCGASFYACGLNPLAEECFGPAVVEPSSAELIDADEVPDSSTHEHSVGCHHHWIAPGEPCRECRQSQKRNQERCPNACPEPGDFWVHHSSGKWERD
jgi:hypothetical protein